MTFDVIYNCVEIGLWGTIGVCFLARVVVKPGARNMAFIAGITFMAFAASDWIELHTGAWWQPWWLFVLKAGCVASMMALLGVYLHARKHVGMEKK